MSSTTWPSGLERPVIPLSPRERPLPRTVLPCDPDPRARRPTDVPPSHIVAWCAGESLARAAVVGTAWLAVDVVGQLLR